MNPPNRYQGINDLLEADLSAWELYNSLSPELKAQLDQQDVGSFAEMVDFLKQAR